MKNKIYWICQFTGWSLFALAQLFFLMGSGWFSVKWVLVYLFQSYSLLFLTHVFRLYIRKNNWLSLKVKSIVVRAFFSSVLLGFLTVSLQAGFSVFVFGYDKFILFFNMSLFILLMFNFSVMSLLWNLIYFGYHISKQSKEREIETWKLKADIKEAELNVLKAQLNPHFMFNAINNIRALILEDTEKSRQMLVHLSDLLRYAIQFNQKETVKLKDEIAIVKDYLILESIQLEDRLSYSFEIEPSVNDLLIPPMTVQLLVENAIKHGIRTLEQGGKVQVNIKKVAEHILIEVRNTGSLNTSNSGTGIGVNTINERLSSIYNTHLNVELVEENEYVVAKLLIPVKEVK